MGNLAVDDLVSESSCCKWRQSNRVYGYPLSERDTLNREADQGSLKKCAKFFKSD